MKTRQFFLLLVMTIALTGLAYSQNKTIVLVRHAEKPANTDEVDPDLTPEGRQRAQHLVEVVRKYKPHEIFSTGYKRTRQTAEPMAAYRHKQIQTYDAAKPAELVDRMMKSTTEHYMIVGHSNTIPKLANLLLKKEVFQNLQDPEYGVIWVVRIRKGVVKEVKVLTY